jgi:uncharacterized protein DUF4136
MRIRMFSGLALALTMTAGAAYAQSVNTDSDPSAPFASYKTYSWTAGTPSQNGLAEQRIHAAVNQQLAGKGMAEVQSNPDLYVATHVTTQEQKELIANGFGPWGLRGGFATVQTYVHGTLIVDLYDAKTKKMVWRGVGTDTASDKPSKNASKINKALAKMFERYPPASN